MSCLADFIEDLFHESFDDSSVRVAIQTDDATLRTVWQMDDANERLSICRTADLDLEIFARVVRTHLVTLELLFIFQRLACPGKLVIYLPSAAYELFPHDDVHRTRAIGVYDN